MKEINYGEPILEVKNLSISFRTSAGNLNAIRGVSFTLHKGETVAIVGESGSGKSITVKSVMGIESSNQKINDGEILYTFSEKGKKKTVDLMKFSKRDKIARFNVQRIAIIFQDPMTALNPLLSIGDQLTEGMIRHLKMSKKDAWKRGIELLDEVGIPNPTLCMENYPHQLSGGMRQRIVIAIALSCNPDILICDEPTTALDVTIQAKILDLIKTMQEKRGISVIFITHDLGVVAKVADYVCVMYAGKIVERGTAEEIYLNPRHPYTWGLLLALPTLDTTSDRLYAIPGTPPNLLKKIVGDAFAPRNRYALNIDYEEEPPEYQISESHMVRSWLENPQAPIVEIPEELQERIMVMLDKSSAEDIRESSVAS